MRSHGKILGLLPYEFRFPGPGRARSTFWNARDERFLVPTLFGVGWTFNLRSAHKHLLQAVLAAAPVLWRIRSARRR